MDESASEIGGNFLKCGVPNCDRDIFLLDLHKWSRCGDLLSPDLEAENKVQE
jgi:hypothetical protein